MTKWLDIIYSITDPKIVEKSIFLLNGSVGTQCARHSVR